MGDCRDDTGEPKNAGKWMTVEMILVNPGTLVSG